MNRYLMALMIAWTIHASPAEAVELETPLYTQVHLRSAGAGQAVVGHLVRYDEQTLTIRTAKEQRELQWHELTGASACTLRSRLIDKSRAADWLALGEFAWGMGVEDVARQALATAVRMDPALKPAAAAVTGKPAGSAVPRAPVTAPAAKDPPPGGPTAHKYEKSTPQRDAEAIEAFRKIGQTVNERLEINLAELQTDHFIIFTDWDRRDHKFLQTNLEAAYAAVSKQFDIPVKENIFIGKLPVFMFDKYADFSRFAEMFDEIRTHESLKGYFAAHGDGTGHLAMWKPHPRDVPDGTVESARRFWAYILTHEFTHAFVSRYRNNNHIPTWLNEGIAEVIASGQFARPDAIVQARVMAARNQNIDIIFSEDGFKPADYYPVMRTVTETLIARNRKKFLEFFDAVKAGTPAEEALVKHYGWDYAQLQAAWRLYMREYR